MSTPQIAVWLADLSFTSKGRQRWAEVVTMRCIGFVATLTIVVACQQVDRAKFDAMNRAGYALKSASTVGATPSRYRELVREFDTELSLVQQRALGQQEELLVSQYRAAYDAYRDALIVLDARLEESKRFGRETVYIEIAGTEVRRIVNAYAIPFSPGLSKAEYQRKFDELLAKVGAGKGLGTGSPISMEDLVDSNTALRLIWKGASDRLDKAAGR